MRTKIGEAIKRERRAAGTTQAALAREVGISRARLAHIEDGRTLLPPLTLLKIANQFPNVDSASWFWVLLSDLWGEPIADLMRAHVLAEAPREGRS